MNVFHFIFILILVSSGFYADVFAYTLQTGIVYSIEDARIESFRGVKKNIDMKRYESYLIDRNFKVNTTGISESNQKKFKDRNVTIYSDGSYSVRYLKKSKYAYYYNNAGKMVTFGVTDYNKRFIRQLRYDLNGNLDSVGLNLITCQYVFDYNGKLIAHWIGKNCYNEQGELIMTRE